jgi:hypothetical protein
LTNRHKIHKFHDIYKERHIMKLKTLVQEDPKRKIKMIITEAQFMALAKNVVALQEQKQIKNTHLIKTEFKEKIDKDLDNKIR